MKIPCSMSSFALCITLAASDGKLEVAEILDDFHHAAAAADAGRYFGHFTADAVFLGTDAGERWTVEELRAYAAPHFSKSNGWTYVASERHVDLSADGRVAWFDERLQNEKYGELRGSGVLERQAEGWKIAQYNLSFPVPNDEAPELVTRVAAAQALGDPRGQQLFAQDGERSIAIWNRVVPARLDRPPRERPVVVLLPSATLAARGLWDLPFGDHSVMDALARQGYDTFAVELGGYGPSSPPEDDPRGGARSACRDLGIAIERIAELRGTRRMVLVGPSWGAQVAGRFAGEHPELVRGLVLYGFNWRRRIPALVLREVFGAKALEARTRAVTREGVLSDFRPGDQAEGLPEAFADFMLSQGRSVPTGALRDFAGELPLVEPERLEMPTLMIAGLKEFEVEAEEPAGGTWRDAEHLADTRAFYVQLPGPRHWIQVPGGGHLVHLETPHVLFQRCLAAWIERLPD
jgi:pimeloyl-ACP methyl ester carboxylesterase